jgi:long-chain acyl-CoA synthetase
LCAFYVPSHAHETGQRDYSCHVVNKKERQATLGEVGIPSGLRQFVSKVAVTALASLNVVGDKLIWSKVKAGFGWKLKTIISGGNALAGSLENFYEPAELHVIVGYGLTAYVPLLSYRRLDGNLVTAGCCDKPCLDANVRVCRSRKQGHLPVGSSGFAPW